MSDYGRRANVDAYVETEILQADPVRLVCLLYRGAVDASAKARQHLRAGQIRERSRQITRASEIINELAISINTEQGGQIGRNLVELYDYMQGLLQQANFRQSDAPLLELEKLLSTLLTAWEQCQPAADSAPVSHPRLVTA